MEIAEKIFEAHKYANLFGREDSSNREWMASEHAKNVQMVLDVEGLGEDEEKKKYLKELGENISRLLKEEFIKDQFYWEDLSLPHEIEQLKKDKTDLEERVKLEQEENREYPQAQLRRNRENFPTEFAEAESGKTPEEIEKNANRALFWICQKQGWFIEGQG